MSNASQRNRNPRAKSKCQIHKLCTLKILYTFGDGNTRTGFLARRFEPTVIMVNGRKQAIAGETAMNDDSAVPSPENTYSYRPSLLGAPHEFRLGEHGLAWNVGRRSGNVAWRDIARVRLSFRPASMQAHRFLTEIWAAGAPKLTIMSTSWKSMVAQERLDQGYTAFVTELHRRLAQAQTQARFEQGTSPLQYWPGLAVFGGVSLALAFLTVRALQEHAIGGALFIAGFLALFLWRGGDFFRRNRPRLYGADTVPAELLPKA
jgi:hypothetical protein